MIEIKKIKNEDFLKSIDNYESDLFDRSKKFNEMSERDEILIEETIEKNLPIIEKNIELFRNKQIKKKYLEDLYELDYAVNNFKTIISKIKTEVDLNIFFKDGKNYDFVELDRLYKEKHIQRIFPKFNYKRWKELLKSPPLELKNFNGEIIEYDPFVVRKTMIAINQMIFNEMDIYEINCGKEGSGKSCFSSSRLLFYYHILKEANLIEYNYDVTKMFFASVLSLLDEINAMKNNDFFKIMTLDEANELNRLNFKEDDVKEFKHDMRVSRKLLRIMTINIQQLGELDLSISLSRVNFIFDCLINNNVKTGTLEKGNIDMYIIPRGDKIYSEYHKKEFDRGEIINAFSNRLDKKKDYYISLPKEYIIHKFKFNGVWGFNKKEYDEFIKNENKKRAIGKNLNMSDLVAYGLVKKVFNSMKFMELSTFDLTKKGDMTIYQNLKKFIDKLKSYFKVNPDIEKAYNRMYNQTVEEELEKVTKIETSEDQELIPNKYKEEVSYLPKIDEEKPKTFYKDPNK